VNEKRVPRNQSNDNREVKIVVLDIEKLSEEN
jgi:hypothetical protein